MTASKKQKPDVSFVMTVYNKEYYLPAVLKALLNQTGLKNPEYIFVDDLSKDRSVEIIEEMTRGIENVTIVRKDKNEGISISINRGIALARGEWVRMLDSDDIFPLNSTEKMLELANKHHADMVYGQFTKTGKEPMEIAAEMMPDDFDYSYKKDALRAVLKGRFTRMGQLIRRSVLQKAGGADTRVFIQDESIPLRAARFADGIVKMYANVVLVPKETNNLSKNTNQLDNDRFLPITTCCSTIMTAWTKIRRRLFILRLCRQTGNTSKRIWNIRIGQRTFSATLRPNCFIRSRILLFWNNWDTGS